MSRSAIFEPAQNIVIHSQITITIANYDIYNSALRVATLTVMPSQLKAFAFLDLHAQLIMKRAHHWYLLQFQFYYRADIVLRS